MNMPNPLRVIVVTLAVTLAASLLVLVGPLTNKAPAQTEPPPGLGGEAFAITNPDDLTFTGSCGPFGPPSPSVRRGWRRVPTQGPLRKRARSRWARRTRDPTSPSSVS